MNQGLSMRVKLPWANLQALLAAAYASPEVGAGGKAPMETETQRRCPSKEYQGLAITVSCYVDEPF